MEEWRVVQEQPGQHTMDGLSITRQIDRRPLTPCQLPESHWVSLSSFSSPGRSSVGGFLCLSWAAIAAFPEPSADGIRYFESRSRDFWLTTLGLAAPLESAITAMPALRFIRRSAVYPATAPPWPKAM